MTRRTAAALAFVVAVFAVAALRFRSAIPPFENSDELEHVGYALQLARTGALPRLEPPGRSLVAQMALQPPLYYLSALPFAGDAGRFVPRGPEVDRTFRYAPAPPGAGPHRHFRDADAGPRDVRALAELCRRLRWTSVAWGLLAAACGIALFVRLSPGDASHAALALALFVLNPRFVEAASAVSNDVAVAALSTAVLVAAVGLLQAARAPRTSDGLALGVLCGLAVLAKLNAVVCLGAAAAAIGFAVGPRRDRVRAGLVFVVSFAVLALPWCLRNLQLYGDPLALDAELLRGFVAVRSQPLGVLDFFRQEFEGLRWSYWAVFGQFAVLADARLYPVLDAVVGVAAILAVPFLARGAGRARLLMPLTALLAFAALLVYTRHLYGTQGRYLFVAAAPIAWLLAGGLLFAFPARLRPWASAVGVATMLAFALYVGWSVLPRAYAQVVASRGSWTSRSPATWRARSSAAS